LEVGGGSPPNEWNDLVTVAMEARAATEVARVVIADDETLFRSGLAKLLERDPNVAVVGQAADGAEAIREVARKQPDVVLMDVGMPNLDGIEATREIVRRHPDVRVLVLTIFDADTKVVQAVRAGASGYMLKDSMSQAIVSSIIAVRAGHFVMSETIATAVLDMLTGINPARDQVEGLTQREFEILRLIGSGLGNKQIAYQLRISDKTVRKHVSSVYEKLGIFDRSHAVIYALKTGLVQA
jgi:DNA-binding NarL/FixJ family response regulator